MGLPHNHSAVCCLRIVIADLDPDYLGLQIFASAGGFSGATFVYARSDELIKFAEAITGFPTSPTDERRYTFGTNNRKFAGGFCSLRFYCTDSSGHAAVQIEIEEDGKPHRTAFARFIFPSIVPGDIDRFISELRRLQTTQSGEAKWESHPS